jgi:hypothetical protein
MEAPRLETTPEAAPATENFSPYFQWVAGRDDAAAIIFEFRLASPPVPIVYGLGTVVQTLGPGKLAGNDQDNGQQS